MSYIFTSESVSGGHPDKVCDQISDAVLDAYLAEDPNSRVACETMIKNNMVYIAGEITSLGSPDLEPIVRKTINDIGYNNDEYGFNGNTCEFTNLVFEQSPDISQGVTEGEGENLEQGAGDQGLMFGYACRETESLMPLPIDLSHKLVKKQADVMKSGEISWLRPDAKSQVSVIYSDDGKTIEGLSAVVLSTQHDEEVSKEEIKSEVMDKTRGINKIRSEKGEDLYEFDYVLLCNKICGASHYSMQMKIIVEEEEAYNEWLAEQPTYAEKL